MFNVSKYTKWYFSIIEKAKLEQRVKGNSYFERHHIYPKSLFLDLISEKSNLVLLTAKEHFICHCLLVKMTSGTARAKMHNALRYFKFKHPLHQRYVNGRLYDLLKKSRQKEDNPMFGKHHTEEAKRKIGQNSSGMRGKKHSPETIAKMRKNNGRKKGCKMEPTTLGRVWVNNGVINKSVLPDHIPPGFTKGIFNRKKRRS